MTVEASSCVAPCSRGENPHPCTLRSTPNRLPTALARGREDVGGVAEGHALGRRDRRFQPPHKWGPGYVVDLPSRQHGVVLVRGVVAVLHEHPTPVPELQRDGDASVRAEAIDVLASL